MQDFTAKQNALFACLDDAASKELKGTHLDQTRSPKYNAQFASMTGFGIRSEKAPKLKGMRGKESIFKKPELSITRCLKPRKTPDYQINPHKWKKYSLADVDISDHTNTAAAFAFLKQMDAQHEAENAIGEELEGTQKIEFQKSAKLRSKHNARTALDAEDAELDKPKLKGAKLVMPEYVIGQKQQRARKTPKGNESLRAAGTLKLTHLMAVDEDEVGEEE